MEPANLVDIFAFGFLVEVPEQAINAEVNVCASVESGEPFS